MNTDEPIEFALVRNALCAGACPDCGGREFLQGPSGGCSTNIKCKRCGSEFNECLPYSAERISEPSPTLCRSVTIRQMLLKDRFK